MENKDWLTNDGTNLWNSKESEMKKFLKTLLGVSSDKVSVNVETQSKCGSWGADLGNFINYSVADLFSQK